MSTSIRFSLAQYDEMIRLGLFEPREEHRVELLYGEIVPIDGESSMSPINPPHDDAVDELIEWSAEVLPRGAVRVRAQGTIGITRFDSQPQPDFAWMSPKRYHNARPVPDDILLLVEVSDSSLAKDRTTKAKLYAESGIQDYWIVNIPDRCVEVRRDPSGSKYQTLLIYRVGQEIHPLAFPEVSLAVARLFPDGLVDLL